MVATDQNSSMIKMMKKATGKEPTYAEIADATVMLSRALAPHCSGLLVDGYYGYASTVSAFAVPPGTGLLIRVEKSGADKNAAGAPCGEIEPGWGVGKIKRCGADAVKLLAQFEPEELDSAEKNFELTRRVYEECIQHDILFLLEPIHFPYNGETDDSPSKIARKARTVIESAKFPADTATSTRLSSRARSAMSPTRNSWITSRSSTMPASSHGCCSRLALITTSTRSKWRWR